MDSRLYAVAGVMNGSKVYLAQPDRRVDRNEWVHSNLPNASCFYKHVESAKRLASNFNGRVEIYSMAKESPEVPDDAQSVTVYLLEYADDKSSIVYSKYHSSQMRWNDDIYIETCFFDSEEEAMENYPANDTRFSCQSYILSPINALSIKHYSGNADTKFDFSNITPLHGNAGESSGMAKVTENDVRYIRRARKQGVKVSEIHRQLNGKLTMAAIYFIINRVTWKHVPDDPEPAPQPPASAVSWDDVR